MRYNFLMETTRHIFRSSHLKAATFNPENLTMNIEFRCSGTIYRYERITPEFFHKLTSAKSPDVWFARNIRRRKFPVAYAAPPTSRVVTP